MSYDCGLFIFTGREETEITGTDSNYTYNVHGMLRLAIGSEDGIYALDGKRAVAVLGCLKVAIVKMEDTPERYLPLNPPNGWGSYEGCLKWLRTILSHCEQHPLATLRIT